LGYLFLLGRGLVIFKTKQQICVVQSACEAGYYAAINATKEELHLRQLMGEIFNEAINGTTTIWEDNQSAIDYLKNALEKTNHIGLKWYFLRITWNKAKSV
jgi:hypothetical protein